MRTTQPVDSWQSPPWKNVSLPCQAMYSICISLHGACLYHIPQWTLSAIAGTVEAGSEEMASAGANSMENLEAAAAQIGTKLPGFVSAGVQGGLQPQGQGQAQQPRGENTSLTFAQKDLGMAFCFSFSAHSLILFATPRSTPI